MPKMTNKKIVVSVLVAIFLMVCLVNPAIAQVSSDAVLILHFDEGSGTIAKDESGCGNDGTIHGATWVDGISGKALSFDGNNDYIQVPHSPSLDITNGITIESWIKTNTISPFYQVIVTKGPDTGASNFNYDQYIRDNDEFAFYFSGGNVEELVHQTKHIDIVPGKWYHVVTVFDSTQDTVKIYVNGVLYLLESEATTPSTNNHPLKIGGKGGEQFFNGIIDEVRIYNYALTEAEIRAAAHSTDAVLIMHFDEGSGSVAKDESGCGNDGTIHDATWVDGISGKALSFDGVDDYVDCGSDSSLNMADEITIEAWVKPSSSGESDWGRIVDKLDGSTRKGYCFHMLGGTPQLNVKFYANSGGIWLIGTDDSINKNEWTHVAVTYDKDAGSNNLKIYINGKLDNQGTDADAITTSSANFQIGNSQSLARAFDGIIDEVAIYSRTLTPEEIKAHYLAKRAGGSTKEYAQPKIEDGDGVTTNGGLQPSTRTVVADDVKKSSGMPIFIVIFTIVGLLVLAYFIFKKSDGSGKERDISEVSKIKSHIPNKEEQKEESGVLEDEDIMFEVLELVELVKKWNSLSDNKRIQVLKKSSFILWAKVESEPSCGVAHFGLGLIARMLNDLDDAIKEFELALQDNSHELYPAYSELALIGLNGARQEKKHCSVKQTIDAKMKYEMFKMAYDKEKKENEEKSEERGVGEIQKYVDNCTTLQYSEIVDERVWDSVPKIHDLGDGSKLSGDEKKKLAESLVSKYPDLDYLYSWRAIFYKREEYYDKAKTVLIEGLKISKRKYNLYMELGETEYYSNNLLEAVRWWIQSILSQKSIGMTDRASYNSFLFLAYICKRLDLSHIELELLKEVDSRAYGQIRLTDIEANNIYSLVDQEEKSEFIRKALSALYDRLY